MEIEAVVAIAKKAGIAVMEVYKKDFTIEYKDDKSPLTEADKVANEIIVDGLKELDVMIPILSEESKEIPYEERKNWKRFWLVDPIDGTKEFIKKNGEFTINIALIEDGIPVLGIVYAPAIELLYFAKKGDGSYKNGEEIPKERNDGTLVVVASKSHRSEETDAFIDKLEGEKEIISMGSSLKLCLVADGSADVYPRLAPTMEWDTGAAHAIVLECGRNVKDFKTGEELSYNKENLLNPWFVVK